MRKLEGNKQKGFDVKSEDCNNEVEQWERFASGDWQEPTSVHGIEWGQHSKVKH